MSNLTPREMWKLAFCTALKWSPLLGLFVALPALVVAVSILTSASFGRWEDRMRVQLYTAQEQVDRRIGDIQSENRAARLELRLEIMAVREKLDELERNLQQQP